MRRPIVFKVLLLLLAFAGGASAQGVQTGTLRGAVLDQQDLAMPGVTVTVSSEALQGGRSTLTAEDGTYVLRTLPPGLYDVTFERTGFSRVTRTAIVPLGSDVDLNVTMGPAGITEEVRVIAEPPLAATPTVGLHIRGDEVEILPASRTLAGIATLSPAVTDNAPDAALGQVVINGGFAFDNMFMLNGVDINDNLFGYPQSLFIEDAIAETQVLTSGISAEYGRFSGGVVNAITKSGGNALSGTFRMNLANPAWVVETPFDRQNDVKYQSDLNLIHEGTLGGPIMRDRLWFFAAGRLANDSVPGTLNLTGLSYEQKKDNKRGEIKVTGTISPNHTVQGGYLTNRSRSTGGPSLPIALDRFTFADETRPNWYTFGNYRGILSSALLAEAQYTERRFASEGLGGRDTNIVNSPILTNTQEFGLYNAPYLDANDPGRRNNRQATASVTSLLQRGGQHELKGGYEFYRSQLTGGNSQSATSYVFFADYVTDLSGNPVVGADGHLIPQFVPVQTGGFAGASAFANWQAVRGATLNVTTQSIYAQDRWTLGRKVTADVGIRYEHARSEATGNVMGVDTATVMPRLAMAFDPRADGRFVLSSTYGHYAGRYNDAQLSANSNVGNPDLLIGLYVGPEGQGRNFAPGFDPDNYVIVDGRFPNENVFFASNLSSPLTKEFTVSAGGSIGSRGYAQATYVWRGTSNLIEDFINLSNGVTTIEVDGLTYGPFTNRVYRNSDVATRRYQGLVFQGRHELRTNWTVNGFWTVQLENDGNYEGEAPNQPGLLSPIGDFPEAFSAARHYPTGRLQSFQRHRIRAWTAYNIDMGRGGDLALSGLLRVESARVFSLMATGLPMTPIQEDLLAEYPNLPSSQDIFFGPRGSGRFRGSALVDASVNYSLPFWEDLRPWLKIDVFNLFNNQRLIAWNTTVAPNPNSPTDALGLPTGYIKAPNFGEATSSSQFPSSLGVPGGRALRMAFGVRF